MISVALEQAVKSLLDIAGDDARFYPSSGEDFPLRIVYGKSSNMANLGNFEARDYEHQFLCFSSQVTGKTRGSKITLNDRTFSIEDVQTSGPAAILYGE